ncbi:MAG: thioredoxin domain-containing protein [Microbacterium sp.]
MSDDAPENAPVPRDRREAVREKAQQVHVQQSRARLLRRSALIAGVVAAVAVVGVVVSWTVGSALGQPQLQPQSAENDGFLVTSVSAIGSIDVPDDADATPVATASATPQGEATASPTATAAAAVEIHVFVDYLSTGARDWQLANSQQLSTWVADGAVTLTYHPVSLLTAKSNGTKYSLRAASAAACVATYSPASFFAFNHDLLSRQPAVDSDGFSDEELAEMAIAAGSDDPKTLRDCVETEAYASWVKAATERAIAGIPGSDDLSLTGTPMIVVNGEQYVGDMTDAAEFSQFVLTSASGAFYKSQTTVPTPTATPTP